MKAVATPLVGFGFALALFAQAPASCAQTAVGPGSVSSGPGSASSGPGSVSSGPGSASSGPGSVSSGPGSLSLTASALDKRLAGYDPKAVAAARHYYGTPAIRASMIAVTNNIMKAMASVVTKQNPDIPTETIAKVEQVIGDGMKARLDILFEMNMVAALDTFTTDEIVALDHFYSSPDGSAIIVKMPKMAAQLPAMIQTIMPDYMAEIKAKLKASDPELKL